jgi:Uncharacterized protein conserved in bacteria (DUF2314)
MSSLIFHVLSWPAFFLALLVFGFAPGAVLRLIVIAFDRDDPRRHELLGELYAVPRLERPFWVAEQLEVALTEGLGYRLRWAATGRIIHRWHLSSGVKRNRKYPDSFQIPDEEDRLAVVPGLVVKLMFEMRDGWGERMWVNVTAVKRRHLVGTLINLPVGIPRLTAGDKIKFKRDHIIDIDLPYEEQGESVQDELDELDEPDHRSIEVVHGLCHGHGDREHQCSDPVEP